jgi:hypothetical protein
MSPGQRPTEADKKLLRLALQSVPSRSVIPTVAKRSGGTCCSPSAASKLNGSAFLPFVIPTEVEGSAVQRTSRGNVFRQGVADSGNLLFLYLPWPTEHAACK